MIGKIRIQSDGLGAKLELDGVDISSAVSGVQVDMRPGQLPEVNLDVVGADSGFELDVARVVVSSTSSDVLVQLGWTPPADKDQA